LIEVRPATEADIEALLALFEGVAEERIYIGTEPGFDRERYRKGWLEAIGDPSQLLLVAVDGDRVVGNLAVWERTRHGASLGMMVCHTHRRRGVGRALLDRATAWGRAADVSALALRVFPHNAAAIALYQSAGFIEIERRERDVPRQGGEVWDTILMRREL
jgi:[ribosomal protein S18]-alanine N-acetyltransferase